MHFRIFLLHKLHKNVVAFIKVLMMTRVRTFYTSHMCDVYNDVYNIKQSMINAYQPAFDIHRNEIVIYYI